MMKQYGFTLFVFITHITIAVPLHLKDLVQLQNDQETIKKRVTLIGDVHAPYLDLVKRASRIRKKRYLSSEEKQLFTIAERTLLSTLREIAYGPKRDPIMLLWEIAYPRLLIFAHIHKQHFIELDPNTDPFMATAGMILEEEFTKALKTNITIFDSDTSKRTLLNFVFSPDDLENEFIAQYPVWELSEPLYKLMDTNNNITHKLNLIRTYYSEATYQKLFKLWNNFVSTQLKPFLSQWITPYLRKYPTISAKKLSNLLQKKVALNVLFEEFYTITNPITEFEIIMNILSTPQSNIIVYAGAFHTNNIQKILVEEFGFETMVDIGDDANLSDEEEVDAQLSPDAWKLLKITSKTALLKYQQAGPLIKKVDDHYWHEIKSIIRKPENPKILKQLELWIKKGFAHYLNSPNTRLERGKPLLLLAIEQNNIKTIELLLKYGAIPNAYWYNPHTENLINILGIVKAMGNNDMINIFMEYGVNFDNILETEED